MVGSRQGVPVPSWISAAAATRVDLEGNVSSVSENMFKEGKEEHSQLQPSIAVKNDVNLGFGERAFSAAGAAIVSAIIVNPLDVAKRYLLVGHLCLPVLYKVASTGCWSILPGFSLYLRVSKVMWYVNCFFLLLFLMLPDLRNSPSCTRVASGREPAPECSRYKGTLDVFYKVIRQEGFARLWRGTNASLALAVPTVPVARSLACVACYPVELARTRMQAFKEAQNGVKLPGVWKTLVGVVNPVGSTNNIQNLQNYRILWTGLGAQLARDVPFSAICWSTLEPIRRNILSLVGDEATATCVLGANFTAGFVAGTLAAAATCPLDVAKTRRQIEKDPTRALKMTTRQTLMEIWRDGGMKGLFTGVGPRVGRAGPSVGMVISSYEVVKYALNRRHQLE
ncbi:hypothetical protein Patl1_00557 [Pistacia atlantica]|uniref:Uncharacterized protein n=1 Tax=Pistacia atlantica TaxID=434234 RepID=A0ACC1CCQ6_9ROSI|nr:hypothetical protein Patl1_00557 [Pistacia atlantica]